MSTPPGQGTATVPEPPVAPSDPARRPAPSSRAGGLAGAMLRNPTLGPLVALVAACTLLGLWQLGVARDEGLKEVVAQAGSSQRAPLPEVLAPHAAFPAELSNRLVEATGTYATDRSLVVTDRRLADRSGSWVVTPLVLGLRRIMKAEVK